MDLPCLLYLSSCAPLAYPSRTGCPGGSTDVLARQSAFTNDVLGPPGRAPTAALAPRAAEPLRGRRPRFRGRACPAASEVDRHVLGLEVLLDTLGTTLAAEAGLLDAAERGGGI